MIYEEEKTVDEMVDDILGSDADESEARSAGPADGKRIYLNRCKDCRQTFETPYVGGKYCPACKRRRISAGQKARQERVRQEQATAKNDPAANDGQVNIGNDQEGKEAENVPRIWNDTQKQWEALDESAPAANETPPKKREPEDMTTGELADELAVDADASTDFSADTPHVEIPDAACPRKNGARRAEPGDVVLALYQAARNVAHRAGIQTRVLIETMYEIDCTLAHIKGV